MSAWLLALMLVVAPPGRTPSRETAEAGAIRYAAIAEAVAAVVAEEPPLFGGRLGRERTAALLVAIAVHESGLRLDVDNGTTRGEGRDVCLLQIRARSREEADEIAHDRRACLRLGLSFARRSMIACAASPLNERLGAYASGSCSRGLLESRAMMQSARRLFARHPPGAS